MSQRAAVEVTLQGEGDTPWDALHVVELEGEEGISQLFRFDLTLYSHERVDPSAPLAASATVTLRHSDELARRINGVVARFAFVRTISNLETSAGKPLNVYRMTLVPKVWRMNLASACRIFDEKDVPTILAEVLGAHGMRDGTDFAIPLQAAGALAWPGGPRDMPRGFRVQYQETDWNFVARIMEEFGVFFYFTHTDGRHQLRLGNQTEHYADGAPASLELGEQVANIELAATMAPEAVQLSDFNPARPSLDLKQLAGEADSKLRLYEPGAGYREAAQGKAQAAARLEEARAEALVATGQSDCVGLVPGHTHTIKAAAGHPAADRELMLTRVRHHAVNAAPDDRYEEHSLGYENSFEAIPAATQYRPPRVTPRPTVRGIQTAIVVGLELDQPDLDPDGRVLVRFHWCKDRSCRLRTGQVIASGPGRGNKRYPRVGDEVLVHFQDGNPDQPVLLGAVYQPAHTAGVYYIPNRQDGRTR